MYLSELPLELHKQLLLIPDNMPCDENSYQYMDAVHNEVPSWFDEAKFRKGQKLYYDNIFSMFVAKLCGLLSTLTVPTMLKILIFTNQSATVEKSYRRYVRTILHMHQWYSSDFRPNSVMWKSLLHVQQKHFSASSRSFKSGYGRITQRDMALTQFGFMGYVLVRGKLLGINNMPLDDIAGFIHFWRVIGWLLGINDRYNLCRDSIVETRELCEYVVVNIYIPALRTPDDEYVEICNTLLESMRLINPLINPHAFKAFTYYVANYMNTQNLETDEMYINDTDRRHYLRMLYILSLFLTSRLLKTIFNLQMRLVLFLIRYLPIMAFFKFGIKKSYVQLYK